MKVFIKFLQIYTLVMSLTFYPLIPGTGALNDARAIGADSGFLETLILWGVGISGGYSLKKCKTPDGWGVGSTPYSFYAFNTASVAYFLAELLSNREDIQGVDEVLKGTAEVIAVDEFGNSNVTNKNGQADAYQQAADISRNNKKSAGKKAEIKKIVAIAWTAAAALALSEWYRYLQLMKTEVKDVALTCQSAAYEGLMHTQWTLLETALRALSPKVTYCHSLVATRPELAATCCSGVQGSLTAAVTPVLANISTITQNKAQGLALKTKVGAMRMGLVQTNSQGAVALQEVNSQAQAANNSAVSQIQGSSRLFSQGCTMGRGPIALQGLIAATSAAKAGNKVAITGANGVAKVHAREMNWRSFPSFKVTCGPQDQEQFLQQGNQFKAVAVADCLTTGVAPQNGAVAVAKLQKLLATIDSGVAAAGIDALPFLLDRVRTQDFKKEAIDKEEKLVKQKLADQQMQRSVAEMQGAAPATKSASPAGDITGNISATMGSLFTMGGLQYTPQTRAALYGVFAAVATWSAYKSLKDAREYGKNADKYQELADQLAGKTNTSTTQGTPDGTDTDKTNIDNTNPDKSIDDEKYDPFADVEGICFDAKYAMDNECKCRESNTCGTIYPHNRRFKGFSGASSPGLLSMAAKQSGRFAEGLARGDSHKAKLAASNLKKNAAAINKRHKELQNLLAKEVLARTGRPLDLQGQTNKFLKSFQAAAKSQLQKGGVGGAGGVSPGLSNVSQLPADKNVEDQALAAPAKFNIPTVGGKSRNPATSELSFNDQGAYTHDAGEGEINSGALGDLNVASMQALESNSVNTNKGANLFRIISNRYLKTATRKLFRVKK